MNDHSGPSNSINTTTPESSNTIMSVNNSDPNMSSSDEAFSLRPSDASGMMSPAFFDANRLSYELSSPMMMSPWNQVMMSSNNFNETENSWVNFEDGNNNNNIAENKLIGSLVREEGHIYSLAAKKDLLYTGSDSKNIRVWKNLKEFSGFKSSSGLVKAIIISSNKIFTGHQDGKIRVWRVSSKNPNVHKRIGTLPTLRDIFKCSIKRKNYVQVKKSQKSALWIKHSDAISCLSLNEDHSFLYSASWDRTFKVWNVSDSKCVESVKAHDDAVNSLVASFEGLVFTGSADGTVKMWKREQQGKHTKHELVQTLLKQDCAVTALVVNLTGLVVYSGSSDGMVNYWEKEKDKELCHGGVLKGHKLAVLCLASAGNILFSGSADKNICLWKKDGTIHTCLSVLTGHTGPVKCLAVEPDSERSENGGTRWILYSGSLDKSIKVWSVCDVDRTAVVQQ